MTDPTEYDPNSRDSTDDPDFVGDANHIGNLTDMVVGDNDHGDAIPEPKCGVCLCNKALKENLRDSLEAHDEMRLEIARLRAELVTALAKIEDLQEDVDYYTEISTDIGYNPHTEAETRMAEENKKRQEERMAKVEWWRGSTDPDVIAKVFPCGRPFTDEEKAEIVRLRADAVMRSSNQPLNPNTENTDE